MTSPSSSMVAFAQLDHIRQLSLQEALSLQDKLKDSERSALQRLLQECKFTRADLTGGWLETLFDKVVDRSSDGWLGGVSPHLSTWLSIATVVSLFERWHWNSRYGEVLEPALLAIVEHAASLSDEDLAAVCFVMFAYANVDLDGADALGLYSYAIGQIVSIYRNRMELVVTALKNNGFWKYSEAVMREHSSRWTEVALVTKWDV